MNTNKKIFVFSLCVALGLLNCSNPVGSDGKSDGVSVNVSVDGIADGGRGLFADTNVILVQVQAKNAASVEVGTGVLAKGATAYTGSLTLSEVGALTFTAVAMNSSGEMLYFGMLSTTVVAGGSITITAGSWSVDWMNLQAVTKASMNPGETFDVYGQIYKGTVTDTSATASPFLTYEVGISTADTDPATWATELWTAATFNLKTGSNHEYKLLGVGGSLTVGTYYVATRAKLTAGKYAYGGTSGLWSNNSKVLSVVSTPKDKIVSWEIVNAVVSRSYVINGSSFAIWSFGWDSTSPAKIVTDSSGNGVCTFATPYDLVSTDEFGGVILDGGGAAAWGEDKLNPPSSNVLVSGMSGYSATQFSNSTVEQFKFKLTRLAANSYTWELVDVTP